MEKGQRNEDEELMLKISQKMGGLPTELQPVLKKIDETALTLHEAAKNGDVKAVQELCITSKMVFSCCFCMVLRGLLGQEEAARLTRPQGHHAFGLCHRCEPYRRGQAAAGQPSEPLCGGQQWQQLLELILS